MRAIYKRELKSFFHSFVGWLFLAATLFLAVLFCLVMLVVDILYAYIDPRIKAKYQA